jgi:hypothetical protein
MFVVHSRSPFSWNLPENDMPVNLKEMKRIFSRIDLSGTNANGPAFAGPFDKSEIRFPSAVGAQTLLVAAALHPLGKQEG